jgi:hypothetical protein
MSRLLTAGFETNDLLATGWTAVTGTAPTIVTTTPHSGTYVLQTSSSAAQSNVYFALPNIPTSGTYCTRFYVRGADMTPATATILARVTSNGAVAAWTVTLNTDGTLTLTNTITSTVRTTTAVLADDTWYRVEVRYVASNTVGELELLLYAGDSTTTLDNPAPITGEDTLSTNINRFYFGKMSAIAGTYLFDDIAVNDGADTGDGQTSLAGPGSIALVVPASHATPVNWTTSAGADHDALLDDLPGTPDDDSTYITASVAGTEEMLFTSALPAEVPSNATIVLGHYAMRARGVATTPDVKLKVWMPGDPGGGGSEGPTHTLTGSYAASLSNQRLVRNLSAFTKSQISTGGTVGVILVTSAECRVTALWGNIEWKAAAGGTNTSIEVPTTIYTGP